MASRGRSQRVKPAAERKTVARISAVSTGSKVKKTVAVKRQSRKQRSPSPSPSEETSSHNDSDDITIDLKEEDKGASGIPTQVPKQPKYKPTLAERKAYEDAVHRLLERQYQQAEELKNNITHYFIDTQRNFRGLIKDQRTTIDAALEAQKENFEGQRAQIDRAYLFD
ncbi:MAG: hypothetical protein MMC33_002569 [Icmadophila ericetorum]|nr:hypothetical protein [Icmadophila ericetorum]